MNDALFERAGKGIEPTREAHRLAPIIHRALNAIEKSHVSSGRFNPETSEEDFDIIMSDADEAMIMHPLIQATMQNAPGISYTLHSIDPGTLRESIFQKDVDLGVFVAPINDDHIRSSHLVSTVTAVITRADHPVYGCKENLSEDDFFNADWVLINSELRRASNLHREVKAKQGSAGILVHDLAQGLHRRSGP